LGILAEMRDMALRLADRTPVPRIREAYFPPWFDGGQPTEHEFMALLLEGGATGLGYLLVPREAARAYGALRPSDYAGTRPEEHLASLGGGDEVGNMVGLAAVNAVCQHAMRAGLLRLDLATDSLGLLDIRDGDRVGMVGLFRPLLKYALQARFELVVIEKDAALVEQNPGLDITLDVTRLRTCDKVLCTSTAVMNNTIDEVLANCTAAKHVRVIGPSAGFLPDSLFARGVDVLGGRYVVDGEKLLSRIKSGERWGDTTQKLCFQKTAYASPLGGS
jgi:uncharacterized protein (DUF4213/DUF364 family)